MISIRTVNDMAPWLHVVVVMHVVLEDKTKYSKLVDKRDLFHLFEMGVKIQLAELENCIISPAVGLMASCWSDVTVRLLALRRGLLILEDGEPACTDKVCDYPNPSQWQDCC